MTPMTPTELNALAEKVEALDGPDRGVDAEIAAACRAGLPASCDWAFKFPKWEGEQFGQVRVIGNVNGNCDYISGRFVSPNFTSSLDAVRTLIGPDDEWDLTTIYNMARATVGLNRDYQSSWPCSGEHAGGDPVLALLAAAIRARAASLLTEQGA